MTRLQRLAAALPIGAALLQGCTILNAPSPELVPPPAPLPALPAEQPAPPSAGPRPLVNLFPDVLELEGHDLGPPVTLTAANVDVRTLIPILAEQLGLSVVLSPDVEGELTLNLQDVPALVALRAVLEQAELVLVGTDRLPLWNPVVFYQLPVNVQTASPEVVQARFGVSREVAEMATGAR